MDIATNNVPEILEKSGVEKTGENLSLLEFQLLLVGGGCGEIVPH